MWQIIKNNNAFLVKRDGAVFSTEKFNIAKKNSYKFSGLARDKAVDVSLEEPEAEKKAAFPTLNTKSAKRSSNKPASAYGGSRRLSYRRQTGLSAIEKQTGIRRDLTKAAKARYTALARSVKAARKD